VSDEDIKDINILDMMKDEDKDSITDSITDSIKKTDKTEESNNDLGNMKSLFDIVGHSGNLGSGDVTEDLLAWFNGSSKLPSDPLVDFLSNAAIKAEFGMFFTMIKNFSRLQKLQEFLDKAEDVIYNVDEIIALDPEELQERMKSASTRIKDIYELNRRTITGMKEKGKEGEMDKLKLLLAAIPNNKLKDILSSLTNL
jgi:hypothetical protein